jgi:hypothetical protein
MARKPGKAVEVHDPKLYGSQIGHPQTVPVNTAPVSKHGRQNFSHSFKRAGDNTVSVTDAPEGTFKKIPTVNPVRKIG